MIPTDTSMKNNVFVSTSAFILSLLLWVSPVSGATFCKQDFGFLGFTQGSHPVFRISENIGGECLASHLIQVILTDSEVTAVLTDLKEFDNWEWIKKGIHSFRTVSGKKLDPQKGSAFFGDKSLQIKAPPPDPKRAKAFEEHIRAGGSNGASWNKEHGTGGIVLPVITGRQPKLLYFYPSGLYVNYNLAEVYYFPEQELVLAFTNQPQTAVGMDTMHGFLLLKVLKKSR